MKRIFKWLLRLFIAAVLLVVVGVIVLLLSYNSILRVTIERQIRAQTGMDVEIGSLKIGLISPTAEIRNLKIHNSRDFGGTPFLDIPEIYVEYDRLALAEHKIHLTLMRFNLGELDIVKNEAGQTNIFSLGVTLPDKKSSGAAAAEFKKQTGFEFKSIDVLNVSVSTAKYIDLKDQRNNRAQKIDIQNQVIKNVTSGADLAGLAVLVALRSGDFFKPLIDPKKSGAEYTAQDILRMLNR